MPRPKLPEDLLVVLAAMSDPGQLELVLGDLLTPSEVEAITERWEIVKLLAAGTPQRRVRALLGASLATISRGSRQLKYGRDGFRLAFDALPALGYPDPYGAKEAS